MKAATKNFLDAKRVWSPEALQPSPATGSQGSGGPALMDVGRLSVKGKGDGKGKGSKGGRRSTGNCNVCGKKGRKAAECW
eukprot:5074044-Alexandrium_andersonii.AAC.1